jgi:hypothetical protein
VFDEDALEELRCFNQYLNNTDSDKHSFKTMTTGGWWRDNIIFIASLQQGFGFHKIR